MSMPETAMNKYHFPMLRQNYVWNAWQMPLVKTKTIAHLVQKTAYELFGFSILALYPGHNFASLLRAESIGHLLSSCG